MEKSSTHISQIFMQREKVIKKNMKKRSNDPVWIIWTPLKSEFPGIRMIRIMCVFASHRGEAKDERQGIAFLFVKFK